MTSKTGETNQQSKQAGISFMIMPFGICKINTQIQMRIDNVIIEIVGETKYVGEH